MMQNILIFGSILVLFLASYYPIQAAAMSSHTAADRTHGGDYSAAEDPDGDDNIKGYNYFEDSRPATGRRAFIFDPNYHAWAAYDEDGRLVNTGKASGGSLYCPDVGRRCTTIVGSFSVTSKGGPDCKSSKYPINTGGGAPMPYCMHFGNSGYAVHGSNDVPDDRNASHGCIRITPRAARWLNQNFIKIGSSVIVLRYSK